MEYRSSASLFGLPLIHVATGRAVDGTYRRGLAVGWVAVGEIAIGVLVSCGSVAVGAIAVGGASLGLLPLGGLAIGVVSVGGLAVGLVAIGGAAIAWYAAIGGLALAHDYAIGGAAFAQHVLSPLAPEFNSGLPPRPQAPFHTEDALWLLAIVVALVLFALRVQQGRNERW